VLPGSTWRRSPGRSARPPSLEQQVLGELGGVKIRGYIDIADVDGNIIDVKTTAKRPFGIDSGYACGLLSADLTAGIRRVKGVKKRRRRRF
jgi:hypothetical protein